MTDQKRKTDCGAADLKNQSNCTIIRPGSKGTFSAVHIYRAPDKSGILAAVEEESGKCYVGYFSTVKRKCRRADLRTKGNENVSIKRANPDTDDWCDAQERLNAYAKKLNLEELPLTIGGEI